MITDEQYEHSVQFCRAVFDGIPFPAFIVNEDVQIENLNSAAECLAGPEPARALYTRGGDILHCVHAERAGCGRGRRCNDCVIRKCVRQAVRGAATCRQSLKAELRSEQGVAFVDLRVSASPLPSHGEGKVLLVLEIGGT